MIHASQVCSTVTCVMLYHQLIHPLNGTDCELQLDNNSEGTSVIFHTKIIIDLFIYLFTYLLARLFILAL